MKEFDSKAEGEKGEQVHAKSCACGDIFFFCAKYYIASCKTFKVKFLVSGIKTVFIQKISK